MQPHNEPPIDPLADTNPSLAVRPVPLLSPDGDALPRWRRLAGWLSLFGAVAFTLATIALLLLPTPDPTPSEPFIAEDGAVTPFEEMVNVPTLEASPEPPTSQPLVSTGEAWPLIPSDRAAALLLTPVQPLGDLALTGLRYEPFTQASSSGRTSIIEYRAVPGDTIDSIAQRFGLQRETIAWCNDRRIVQVLRPNDVLVIPPVDGACQLAIGSATIAQIAERLKVSDPYAVIDSPYNEALSDYEPDQILPSGTFVFVPGGQGELITWRPPVEQQVDANGNVVTLAFAPGQAGSCGAVAPGGGSFWTNPLPNGTFVRGYYAGHTGIDIAASEGTPIRAANSGPVLYSGWNTWGYGNTVVLAHGPFSTLYGHMSSTAVRCGEFVSAGQVIGYVGSTGNSSGPHLHFEIRYNNEPQNPSGTPGIGW